jgi:hypothetical protein
VQVAGWVRKDETTTTELTGSDYWGYWLTVRNTSGTVLSHRPLERAIAQKLIEHNAYGYRPAMLTA